MGELKKKAHLPGAVQGRYGRWAGVFVFGVCAAFAAPPLVLFPVSDTMRVFEDGYGCPAEKKDAIRVFGLRGETVSAQCAVRAGQNLSKLGVSVGALKKDGDAAAIAAANVGWNFVSSVLILTNSPALKPSDLTRRAPARFPDCLADERACDVTNGAWKAVYLTVRIPPDAEPGDYQGKVTVASGEVSASLPVTLSVYPLTLPERRHFKVAEWFSTRPFKRHHDIDSPDSARYWEMLRLYAENMVAHRQNVFLNSLWLIESTLEADGTLRCDFSAFDRFSQVFWDTGGMDAMETGFVAERGKEGWSSRDVRLRNFTVRDAATGKTKRLDGETFLAKFLPLFVAHLKEKAWLDKTLFHICDEPANHNVLAWRQASDFVHRCAPELRRIDAIETPHCLDCLEVWVPKLDHLATWQEAFEDAQRRGNEVWFYTVGIFQGGSLLNKTVDVPLIETRLIPWLAYRYDLTGYLHWGFNQWTDDPWEAPGKHRGDGWHVYPKRDGLLNSLRWEQMRNGLEDYECLWLLEDKIRQMCGTLSPRAASFIDPRRRGVEIASRAADSYTDFSRDPAALYAAKRQAVEETLALDRSPRLLLQTDPPEHAVVANNCAIDICGWAEPGTRLRINRKEVTVQSDGLFFAQVCPSRSGTLAVEAEHAKGRKTFDRDFRLQVRP